MTMLAPVAIEIGAFGVVALRLARELSQTWTPDRPDIEAMERTFQLVVEAERDLQSILAVPGMQDPNEPAYLVWRALFDPVLEASRLCLGEGSTIDELDEAGLVVIEGVAKLARWAKIPLATEAPGEGKRPN